MKNITFLFSLALAAGSLAFVGCSKSGSSNNSSGSGGSSASSTPVDLKLKWEIGKHYDMAMNLDQQMDYNVPGRPVHQGLKLTQGFQYLPLKDLDNGGHQVQLEFNRQNMDVNQNGKDVLNYDTSQSAPVETNGPAGMVAAAMHAMLGVPLTFTFAADGTVEKIDGTESMASAIGTAVPNQRVRMQLGQLYDEDTLKEYGAFAQSLPNHPVKVGDTWSESHDMNSPAGVLTVDSSFTFKNLEQHNGHNCAHIVFTGDIKTKSATASQTGAVVNIKKGTLDGESWFDPDLGMFVDINSGQDITLDITTRQIALTQHIKRNADISLQGVN